MPRIAEARLPAEPSSPRQLARYRSILHAAAEHGAREGLEHVQMHDVARDAEVAIGTLYRYFPSKTHLFTGVMAEHTERFGESVPAPKPGDDLEEAVYDVLVRANKCLVRKPLLATAMLQSANAADPTTVSDVARMNSTFLNVTLRTLRIDEPTAQDVTLVRLLLQCWYGVLTSSLNGRMALSDAEADLRLACRLLLARRSNAAQADTRSR